MVKIIYIYNTIVEETSHRVCFESCGGLMIGLGAWPNLTGGRVGGHGFALATETPFGTVFLGL